MNATVPRWVRLYRVFFALLGLLAVIVQARTSVFERGFPMANFLSFFTIECNLFGIAVLLREGLSTSTGQSSSRTLVRGAAVLYLSITGVVYGVLLAGYQEELQTTIPWVDTVLHRILPLAIAGDWLLDPPPNLKFRKALIWLIYPFLYLAYSLVRGPIADWYPYPFLNPAQPGGYGAVAAYASAIALCTLFLTWLVIAAGRHVRLVVT